MMNYINRNDAKIVSGGKLLPIRFTILGCSYPHRNQGVYFNCLFQIILPEILISLEPDLMDLLDRKTYASSICGIAYVYVLGYGKVTENTSVSKFNELCFPLLTNFQQYFIYLYRTINIT